MTFVPCLSLCWGDGCLEWILWTGEVALLASFLWCVLPCLPRLDNLSHLCEDVHDLLLFRSFDLFTFWRF